MFRGEPQMNAILSLGSPELWHQSIDTFSWWPGGAHPQPLVHESQMDQRVRLWV